MIVWTNATPKAVLPIGVGGDELVGATHVGLYLREVAPPRNCDGRRARRPAVCRLRCAVLTAGGRWQ